RFSIEDFHQSEGWLTGFKKRHGLQQFRKQGEASSAPSRLFIQNRIEAYDNVQDGFVEKLADYNIFEALQNSAEACIEDEEVELENLIAFLPEGDHLNAREYINIEDEIAEGALTDDEIIDAILNADKEEEIVVEENELMPIMEKVSLKEAEKAVNNITQFLYEQGSEFGDVNDELKILKGLHKRIKLLI
ncbi:3654_t:CDS:2, partial [Rhizophagus irregularis]